MTLLYGAGFLAACLLIGGSMVAGYRIIRNDTRHDF